jgi:hypothetical protein
VKRIFFFSLKEKKKNAKIILLENIFSRKSSISEAPYEWDFKSVISISITRAFEEEPDAFVFSTIFRFVPFRNRFPEVVFGFLPEIAFEF